MPYTTYDRALPVLGATHPGLLYRGLGHLLLNFHTLVARDFHIGFLSQHVSGSLKGIGVCGLKSPGLA